MVNKIKVLFLAVAIVVSSPVFADPLKSVLEAFLVVTEKQNGKEQERLESVDAAEPGSLIEYVLTYTNTSDEPLTGFAIKTPVPNNTSYQADSANASVKSDFRVSIDDGKTFEVEPVKRTVIENGVAKEIVIPASEYDAVAWNVKKKLKAEKSMTMRYRVVID